MNFVVANALSTTDMAAQVIILSFFNCICMLADALNMTAQSFVPTVFEQTKSIGRLNALKKMTRDFAKASSIFGIGSLVGARFEEGRPMECPISEVLVSPGASWDGSLKLPVRCVDTENELFYGNVLKGEGPVLVTFELMVVETIE